MYEFANYTAVLSDKESISVKSNRLIITSHIYYGGGCRQNPRESLPLGFSIGCHPKFTDYKQ
jgi:hypothetical protein